MPRARARTTTATYEMQNVMWAMTICPSEPFWPNSWPKKMSRLMPMMISGVTIGSRMRTSEAPWPRNRLRARARPSSDPMIVDTMTATNATWSVRESASSRSLVGEQLRVPVGREPQPHEVPARHVEAEDDQDHDRGEQERVDQDGECRQPRVPPGPHPNVSWRSARIANRVPARVMTISMNPSAEPYGQSRPLVNRTWTILAIVEVCAPPSRSGVT